MIGLVVLAGLPRGTHSTLRVALLPFWWSDAQRLAALSSANVPIVAIGRWSSFVLVKLAKPEDESRLRAIGPLLLIDPTAIPGCAGLAKSNVN